MQEAAYSAGAPEGPDTVHNDAHRRRDKRALLKHKDIGMILATGGEAMVRAAYSSGNPALGVGPGNGPAFIERSADIPACRSQNIDSKTFDNGHHLRVRAEYCDRKVHRVACGR